MADPSHGADLLWIFFFGFSTDFATDFSTLTTMGEGKEF